MTTSSNKDKGVEKTCNQCQEDMQELWQYKDKSFYYCVNPKCPNFALLQIPVEDL